MNTATAKPERASAGAHPVRHALLVIFTVALAAAAGVVGWFGVRGYAMYQDAIAAMSVEEMAEGVRSQPGYVTLDQMPELYKSAVISVEDRRFFQHPGFDIIATGRALVNDIRAGAFVEGGSTITQQLAKNQWFTQDKFIERKFAEVFMAFAIEDTLTKDEILELYLNSIYFGNGYYGIGAATQGYLEKAPMDMDPYECTLLAGVPNAPSVYNPHANPELAGQRQQQVVEKMLDNDAITKSQAAMLAAA